jgi:hypothetical protein
MRHDYPDWKHGLELFELKNLGEMGTVLVKFAKNNDVP